MLAHHPNAVAGQAAAAAGQQAAAAAAADEDAARVAALQEDLGIAELAEDGTTTERRLALVTALRERFEAIASTSATSLFHRASFPALMKILSTVPPNLNSLQSPGNKLRSVVVELLGRVHVPELSKGSISELVPACHALLTHDHEEHGIVAQRLLFDVHKAYRGQLEEASGPFFEWLKQLYEGLPAAYRSLGLEAGAPPGGATLLPARASFKLASEVALMIVFLLQCYPKRLQQYASALLPLMVQTAGIPGPELSAVADDRMGLYSDFRMAQIKTLAFLTVMARSGNLSPLMAPHRNAVCEALVRVMRTAPDVLSIRKELMVAVRNVLPTAYRQGLQERIDTLLDERTLLGRGRACMEGLRPVAYSTLAELVASSKADLSYPQLVRVVHIFARNAHDCTLPASLQSTSLRLLYNLIETIFQRRADARTCEAYRLLLSAILDCFVSKLGALRALAPKYIAEVKELDEQRRTRKAADAERAADAAAAAGLHVRRLALEKGALRTRLMEEQRAAQAAAEAAAAGDAPTQPAGAEEAQPPGTEPMQVERPPQAQGAAGGAAGAEAAAGGGGGASEGEQPKQEEAPADAEKEAAEAGAKLKLLDEAAEKDAFRALLPSLGSGGTREKEVNEYRGLLQTVLSCLKSVLYTIVAFHSNRGLQQPLSFPVKPWSTRLADVRVVSRLLPFGLPALAFFEALPHGLHDMREQFADLFTVLQDGRDFADVVSPRLPLLFSLLRGNRWFMRVLRHLVDGETAARSYVNRHAIACVLRFLIAEKLECLEDMESEDGKLTAELFELCFEALPRVQLTDAAKASHMAQVGAMPVERVVLPHVMALMQAALPKLAAGGRPAAGCLRVVRCLFYCLAQGKFLDIQAAFGTSGLHARLVDLSLAVLHGPVASKAEADAAAELCLLVPARLEHLIPPMPRLMHAVAHALASGSDQSISCALRVLDLWVDSFNPEFIERSMAGVIPRLMGALWAHVRPHPYPYGAKVAEVLGKLGGRSRRWLAAPQEGEYKPIPEYGLRVILAFPPHTSFLVPLDRCVQFATAALNSPTADVHHRRHALRLLHICVSSLSKVALPAELAAPGADVLGKLEGLLFSDGEPTSVPQEFHWPNEMGVKTKKQHAAEKQMLEQLLVTTMVASAEGSDLAEEAAPFALATVRHFALLLAVGWGAQAAPPVPPSSRHMRYGAMGGVSACVAILKHLDPRIILDAFQAGLGTPQAGQRAAVVRCMAALVDALLEVGTEQAAAAAARRAGRTQEADSGGSKGSQHNKEKDKEGKESGGGGGSDAPTPAATDAGAAVPADAAAAAAKPEAEGGGAAAKPDGAAAANGQDARADAGGGARDGAGAAPPTLPPRYVVVVHDLLVRSMHCCYGDTWVVRLGGIAALAALAERLPPAVLERPAAHMLKAMLAALRCLPDHAEEQQAAITAALVAILRRALGMAPAEGGGGGGGEGPEEGQTAELEKEKEQKEQEGGEAMDVDGEGEEEGGQRAGSKRGAPRAPAGPPRKQARAAGQEAAGGGADGEGGGDAAAAGGGEGKAAGTAAADAAPAEGAAAADGARAGGGGGGVMPSSPARRQLLEIMTRELVSGKSSDTIRAAAARCLGVLAEAEGLGLSGLLGGMLRPLHFIVERRLLPLKNIAAQSNYAHSMAFVIRTCPAQLELDAEVASFVADAASIMETDDAGISGAVTVRGGPPKPEVLTRLRVACMEALTAALGWEPFRTGEGVEAVQRGQGGAEVRTSLNHLRERIMKIFITELGSSSPRVVGLASAGVKTALDHGLLAKPVLQDALRPILTDLAYYQRITLGLLRHLHRLLDLLSGQFNVTLGEKLTEHLKKWVEVTPVLNPPQPCSWEPGTEAEIAAGMLDIFHKLPPQAKRFLETQDARPGIVVLTIGLEESLPRLPGPALPSRLWSPYRAPLARFLCRYPEEAVAYFLEPGSRLASESYFVRLLDVIRNPIGAPLLQALADAHERLTAILLMTPPAAEPMDPACGPVPAQAQGSAIPDSQFNCVHLVRAITKLKPDWLPESLYQALLTRWRAPERKQRIRQEAELPRQQVLESKRLARAILSYVERRHSEVAPLFDLLTIFSSGTAVDFTFLKTFFQAVVAEQYSAEEKRAVLAHWLSLYKRGALAHDDGVTALRLLVTPMVGWAMEHGQADVLTPELVRSLVADVFKNPEEGGASEQVQLELVQLCGTLIHHAGHLFVEHRKELIQFGWWTLKYDNAAKPHAFLCVARFFRAFSTPEKIMLQVYVALARLAQTEAGARDAVRQAIDIMIPTLAAVPPEPQGGAKPGGGGGGAAQDGGGGEAFHDGAHPLARAASAASPPRGSGGGGGEGSGGSAAAAGAAAAAAAQAPSYARYLKKVLVEEGHSSATLLHIFQLIVRNRDRFFSSRAQFMPAMLNSLTRMGLPSNTTLENRLLAVDMAASLLKWDQAAAREEGATGAEEAGAAAAAPAQQLGAAPSLTSGQPGAGGSPAGTEGGGRPPAPAGSKDRLTPGMDEMIVNFLVRMAFVSCDARDRDEAGWRKLHAHCLEVLRDAVRLRPPVALKMHYFEKFLQQNLQQQAAQAATAQQTGQAPPTDPAPALMTGLRIANIFLDYAPDVLTGCAANQLAMMMEPSLTCRHKAPVDLLGACMRKLFSCYPPGLPPRNTAEEMAGKLEARLHEVINKFLILLSDVNTPLHPDMALYACNCVAVMRAAMAAQPDCMQPLIGPLLKAMHRMAKEHNTNPQMGLLAARAGTPPREEPADSEFGTGAWFMYNALNAAVPSALVLSAEHRRHFLSTLVMLITGQSVRQGQTDPAIMLTVLHMLRTWLLGEPPAGAPGVPGGAPGGAPGAPGAAAPRGPGASGAAMLTSKELLVIMQRVAQVDRMQVIPPALKPRWDSLFLDLLYRAITQPQQHVGGAELAAEVFTRVERTFCCGLQSSDPATRQKFFRLYASRLPPDLFDRLRYIIAVQDWDFISHTFWLKHGVALLFDSLNLRDPITLAYNSAHVPPLFNFVESLAFPPLLHQQQQQGQQGQAAQQQGQGQQGQAAQGAQAQGEAKPGQPGEVKQEPGAEAPAAAAAAAAVKLEGGQAPEGEAPAQQAQQAAAPQPASGDTAEAAAGAGAKGPSPPPPPPPTSTSLLPTLDLALPPALSSILKEQVEFMRTQTSLRSEALVSCLIEVLLSDPAVAHHLWVLLFPIVWTSLAKEQQTALAKPIIQLLSKEHHTRQALLRPTVGATLLEGISLSQPQPKIPAEMIKYMGRHFHAWHTAISMLESHVGLFPGDMRCFDAVCELYRVLGEDDMVAGLWARRAAAPETRLALALGQHGFLVPAQQACLELMSRSVTGAIAGVTKSEMVLWHGTYLACCAELHQWDTVGEYAKAVDHGALQLEAAARLHDWAHLKQALPKAAVEEGPELSFVRAQLALQEVQVMEVDKICKQGLMQCVNRWWMLPEGSPWAAAPVLHAFQRAVELQESWRIMVEFSMQGGPGGAYQDHKDICETWKLRTPNEWEPLRWWSDLLSWRNQVYNLTIRQFTNLVQLAPTMHQMGYRDKAWSVNRLGHIARLHYQPEACCHIINTLYGFNAMEVQEAFVKVAEQAQAYLLQREEHMHGLNLINSTNLDYFQPTHQAEMINLKAQFLEALGEADAAQATFSEALTLWSLCPDAWVAWARFCDGRYAACGQASWLEFAGACYTQAVKLSGLEARALVPRLLHLLMLDSAGPEAVGRTLIAQCADMPTWVWLPWVPQLMMSLQRPEVATARRILSVAAGAHPQQLYWHVRPAMMAMKEAAVKAVNEAKAQAKQQQQQEPGGVGGEGGEAKASPASGGGAAAKEGDPAAGDDATGGQQQQQRPASPQIEKPIEVMAYEACRDVVEALRAKLSAPLQVLEQVMAELGQRFLTRTEERLLAVVHTLQQRTYKMALPAGAPVVEAFKRELAGVCKACSAREGGGGPQSRIGQYQVQFARDLDPASPSSPQTLGEMTERLKGWRIMLETVIEDTFPPVMKTENEAPMLLEMSLEDIEMPGQAFPAPDSPDMVYVERCGAEIEVVRRNCNSFRRLKLYGSDGVARSFLIQNTQTITGSEERIAQLLRNANGLLDAHPESRRRALRFNAPAILVPWAGVRMVEDDPSAVPFLDAYETHCARYGREPDAPILAFKAATCTDQGITADPEVRLQAYVHVVEQYVTENIFSQYMYKTMVENSRTMWTFKKQFALSTAMSAVACHLLLLTGRSPGKVLVSKASGRVGQAELISAYDTRFQLERGHESVPFRLTRNMQAFIGPHGMEGLLLAAGAAAAQGLLHQHGSLPSQLALFLRDDILAWAARRSGARSIAALAASLKPAQLDACVNLNVKAALDRTSQLGPASSVTCEGNPQQGMRHLVEAAVAPANLCRMEPTWQPWL